MRRQFKTEDEPYPDRIFIARVQIFKPCREDQRTVLVTYERRVRAGSQAEADMMFAAIVQEECCRAGVRLSEWLQILEFIPDFTLERDVAGI